MILKKNHYPIKNGYIIQTITGKDNKGNYFFIGIFSDKTLVEKFYFRNSTDANKKFKECRDKYQTIEKKFTSLESPLPTGYNLTNNKLCLKKGGSKENVTHEIRSNAKTIPERIQARSLRGSDPSKSSRQTSAGSSAKSGDASGIPDQAPGENRRNNGNIEGNRSASVDWHDEQHQGVYGGDNYAGADLHLNTERKKGDSVVKETVPPFLCEKLLTALLCCDEFLKAKRDEVIRYFKEHTSADERADYMYRIYNDDYTELIVLDQQSVGYKKDENGLLMWEGNYLNRTAEAKFSWALVQAYINNMIQKKIYLPSAGAKAEPKNGPLQQLSLFDVNAVNTPINHTTISTKPISMPISEEKIRAILRTGGNRDNSRIRIYAQYRLGKTPDYMVSFLEKEYGQTGKGFIFNQIKIAVWFNGAGMHISYGESANHANATVIVWEKVEEIIREMIECGDYMCADEISTIDKVEHHRIANMVMTFFRDMVCEFPAELTNLPSYNWSNGISYLLRMFSTFAGRKQLLQLIDNDLKRLRSGEIKQCWRMVYTPEDVRESVADLLLEQHSYPAKDSVAVNDIDFITQDEIDAILLGGSSVSGCKKRIYDYFNTGHTKDENIAFLKEEYGTGGRSHALPGCDKSWEEHNYKGIQLIKGDISAPTVHISLSWSTVEKRICELIKNGRFTGTPYDENQDMSNQKEVQLAISSPSEETISQKPSTAKNFRLVLSNDDINISPFSPKEKFKQNMLAIQTMKKIESEKRYATSEEQTILSKYVGWGGLSEAFDQNKTNWSEEYSELKELLTDDEYVSARESVLNAHYTSPIIIKFIYDVLDKFGFEKGNILEPAVGIGNFFSLLPDKMQSSKLYGVELDSLTGRIARLLYPNADIQICGFEKTNFPNDFFDVAIGNIPFGQYKVNDPGYNKHNFLIHDFFFAKTLDKVRPGGIIIFITSKGTMDKQNTAVRQYIAERAELLGAVRLPNTAFKSNANTEVTADILFLKKRDRVSHGTPDWVNLAKTSDGIEINKYFTVFPKMVLGQMKMVSGPYGMQAVCLPNPSFSLQALLETAMQQINGSIEPVVLDETVSEQESQSIPATPNVKNYSFTLVNDKPYYRENSVMTPVNVSETAEKRIKGLIQLRDCTYKLIDYQLKDYTDEVIQDTQTELNQIYDGFTKEFGHIVSQDNRKVFEQDCSYYMLSSLEILDEEGKYVRKADIFHKRTINKPINITHVDTAIDALAVCMNEKAQIDLEYMTRITGKKVQEITDELSGIIFQNPITGRWESADEYLSGNVVDKLTVAKNYSEKYPQYISNVKALEKVQPQKLTSSEIEVRLGANWIDPKYIKDFMRDIFKTSLYFLNDHIDVLYSDLTGEWRITHKNYDSSNPIVNKTYGTNRLNGYYLLEKSLNQIDAKVYDIVDEKRILNHEETTLALTKQENIKEVFKDWIFSDPKRRHELCDKYNSIFNTRRPREYNGSHLQFHGMASDITLRPHQKNAVARILYGNNTLLAHCVGAGKSATRS